MTTDPRQGRSWKPEGGEPSAVAPMRLRRLNRWLVEGLREDLADLYVDSRATAPGDAYRRPSRQNFLNRLTADMRRPGFGMVIAETDGLRGCAFGFPGRSDGSWWLGFDGPLPRAIEQLTVSGRVFTFSGILIRPHPQDRGLARRVQEGLLTDHQASLGATLVDRADRPTLAALRSWGWLDVGGLRGPADPTVFRVLVFGAYRAEIDQASGMVMVQLGVGIEEAFVRLRAYAYAHGRRLADVAADVVARQLRFPPDAEPDQAEEKT
ncbi:ANTAR domain-containing protein [Streptomyces sp. NPDC001351]|uniref:ANTAR domain-containing protein n=1 Tax=Streptomyces sp. NPDC001351 TaxID=3364564 RepID=UPI0036C4D53B